MYIYIYIYMYSIHACRGQDSGQKLARQNSQGKHPVVDSRGSPLESNRENPLREVTILRNMPLNK